MLIVPINLEKNILFILYTNYNKRMNIPLESYDHFSYYYQYYYYKLYY